MKAGSVFIFSCAWPILAFSQSRNENLVFAENVWLRFADDQITWNASDYHPTLRNACISDPLGNLAVLADDRGIRNGLYELMQSGDSLSLGWSQVSSKYVILPKPGAADRYVIFRNEAEGERRGGWAEVDMSANGGLGAVIGPTTWYTQNTTAKLLATPHANGTDYWIIQHPDGTNSFESWQLTATGLLPTPVISITGSPFMSTTYPTVHPDFRGPMKATMAGDKVALVKMLGTTPDTAITEVFEFDAFTGELDLLTKFDAHAWRFTTGPTFEFFPFRWAAGLDFSASGEHMYVAYWDTLVNMTGNICLQYDISDATSGSAQESGVLVGGTGNGLDGILNDPAGEQLLLAPNGSILGRQVSTDLNEQNFNAALWVLTNLPVSVPPTSNSNNLELNNLWQTSGLRGFPEPCKRYHDSEPIWLGTKPATQGSAPLKVVPNPMIDRAALHLSGRDMPDELRWMDAGGRVIRTSTPWRDGPTVVIDRGGLADGLYNISVLRKGRMMGNVRVLCQ